MLNSGVAGFDNVVAALKRARPAEVELKDSSLSVMQAEAIEEYLASNRCATHDWAFRNIQFQPDAFRRLCAGFSRCGILQKLAVTGSHLTDNDAEELATGLLTGQSPLRVLDLGDNDLGSPTRFIEKLKRVSDLERLNLSGNEIACADTLAGAIAGSWSRLHHVGLKNASLTTEEKDALREAADAGTARYGSFGGVRTVAL
jgi:hypothetical protein